MTTASTFTYQKHYCYKTAHLKTQDITAASSIISSTRHQPGVSSQNQVGKGETRLQHVTAASGVISNIRRQPTEPSQTRDSR